MHSSRMHTARSSSRLGGLHQAPPPPPIRAGNPQTRHPPRTRPSPGAGIPLPPGAGTPPPWTDTHL